MTIADVRPRRPVSVNPGEETPPVPSIVYIVEQPEYDEVTVVAVVVTVSGKESRVVVNSLPE